MGKNDEGNWGIRISYNDGTNETRWYETQSEREHYFALLNRTRQFAVKSMKRKKR